MSHFCTYFGFGLSHFGVKSFETDNLFSEPTIIKLPVNLDAVNSSLIVQKFACGYDHTLVLFSNGSVWSCGNNNHGQLGRGSVISTETDQQRNALNSPSEYAPIEIECCKDVAAGDRISLALTISGSLYVWGSNSIGKILSYSIVSFTTSSPYCLLNKPDLSTQKNANIQNTSNLLYSQQPLAVKTFTNVPLTQIACGQSHFLVLDVTGVVWSWGLNDFGQLGYRSDSVLCTDSTNRIGCVDALKAVPIVQVACGANHSLCLSATGHVFSFGSNRFGQLGVPTLNKGTELLKAGCSSQMPNTSDFFACDNNSNDNFFIKHVQTLHSVVSVACGSNFCAALTKSGGVWTWGSCLYGQLGHGSRVDQCLPRQVFELMGASVSQLVCGRHHFVALLSCKRILVCGLGSYGQLGLGPDVKVVESPRPLSLAQVCDKSIENVVSRIYAGGDMTIVETITTKDYDNCIKNIIERTQYKCRTWQIEADSCPLKLHNPACWNASFFLSESCISELSTDLFDIPNCSRILADDRHFSSKHLHTLLDNIPIESSTIVHWSALRVFILLLFAKEFESVHLTYADRLCQLDESLRHRYIGQWMSRWLNVGHCLHIISIYKRSVITLLDSCYIGTENTRHITADLLHCMRMLELIHRFCSVSASFVATISAPTSVGIQHGMRTHSYTDEQMYLSDSVMNMNRASRSTRAVSDEAFYIPELSESISVPLDYVNWLMTQERPNSTNVLFFFCHFPFVFDAVAKTEVLHTDALYQMRSAITNSSAQARFWAFLSPAFNEQTQFLVLEVNRSSLVRDTITQLSKCDSQDLHKPLRVRFIGEEAEDAGGVRKEFFLVLMREMMDPKYGMFVEYKETNCVWFNGDTYEDSTMYFLIGLICGLAIYNSTIVNIPFPLCLYDKLLNHSVSLDDLSQLTPSMVNSFKYLLDFSVDPSENSSMNMETDQFEETFSLNFAVTREVFGEKRTTELIPNGAKVSVTEENRNQYVELYVDWILSKSIASQFQAFSDGFHKVCGRRILSLFSSSELMTLVRGDENYDWHVLEEGATYHNGYTSTSESIKLFWQVFHSLDESQKRKFLLFLTGSDRVPILGMKKIDMRIRPSTGGTNFLPVAHTCFNLLDLPHYATAEKLKYKLLQAIQFSEGFGLA